MVGDARARRRAVLGLAHVEAGAAQPERDHVADRLLVFDDQDLLARHDAPGVGSLVAAALQTANYDTPVTVRAGRAARRRRGRRPAAPARPARPRRPRAAMRAQAGDGIRARIEAVMQTATRADAAASRERRMAQRTRCPRTCAAPGDALAHASGGAHGSGQRRRRTVRLAPVDCPSRPRPCARRCRRAPPRRAAAGTCSGHRCEARDRRDRQARAEREALRDARRDAQPGERAGTATEREAVEVRERDAGLAEQLVDHRQHQLRVAALGELEAQTQLAVRAAARPSRLRWRCRGRADAWKRVGGWRSVER